MQALSKIKSQTLSHRLGFVAHASVTAVVLGYASGVVAQVPVVPNKAPFATQLKTVQVELPVWLDQKELAVMRVQLSGNRLVGVHRAQLYALLATRLTPTTMSELAALWANEAQTWVNPKGLSDAGLALQYDAENVQLLLTIPLTARKPQRIFLAQSNVDLGAETAMIKPQTTSFIANQRLSVQANHAQGTRTHLLSLSHVAALRTDPWVLEVNTLAQSQQTSGVSNVASRSAFTRGDIVAVQDFPASTARLKIGDFTQRSMGSLSTQAFLGLQFERNYALDQRRTQLSRPAQTLSLPNGAAVDVYINGVLARSLRLEAGVHDLQQLPVNGGANEVSIRVTEPNKPPVWYRQNFFFNTSLLASHAYDYQWAVGVPLTVRGIELTDSRHYDHADPQLVSTHRYGVTPELTLGAGLKWGQQTQQYYLESTTPLAKGLWATELTLRRHTAAYQTTALSSPQGFATTGWQAKTQWVWFAARQQKTGWHNPSVNVQAVFSNGLYLDPQGLNAAHHELGLRGSAAYGSAHSVNLSLRQNLYLDGNSRNASATWTYKHSANWSFDTLLAHTRTRRISQMNTDPSLGKSLLFTLRWHPASEGFSGIGVISSVDVWKNTRSIDYNQHLPTDNGLWQFSARSSDQQSDTAQPALILQTTPTLSATHVQALRGSYQHSRYEIEAQFDRFQTAQSNNTHSLSSNFGFSIANAVGFAGAQWFTSRPIHDSAAVIVVPEKMAQSGVFVQDAHPAAAKQDGWGNPVVAAMTQAVRRELTVDAEHFGKGQSFAEDRFWLKPAYRSVSVVTLALNAQTQVTGTLLGSDGKPAGLLALQVKGDVSDEVFDVFTNRNGIFFTPALKPGRYTLMLEDNTRVHAFEITPDSPWKINLAPLTVSRTRQ